MLRTKASTYAIMAVVEIAKRQRGEVSGVQAGEIARSLHLPSAYAAKVLTQLARGNVLRSDRGPRGGFRLMRAPDAIPILEIVEAVDGTIDAGGEFNRHNGGDETVEPLSPDSLDRVFDEAVAQVRNVLRRRTIADLIGTREPAFAAAAAAAASN